MANVMRVDDLRDKPTRDKTFGTFKQLIAHEGRVVRSAAYDAHGEAPIENLWIMPVQVQRTEDPKNGRYTPTALLLQRSKSLTALYRRFGCVRLDEDHEDFFDDCELERITLV